MTTQSSAVYLPLVIYRPCSHLGYMDLPCCDSVKWIPHLQVACCGLQLDKQLRAPAKKVTVRLSLQASLRDMHAYACD